MKGIMLEELRKKEGEWMVSDLMTKELICIEKGATMHDAVRKMLKHRIHGLVVTEDEEPMGIVTTYDALLIMERGEFGGDISVENVMSKNIIGIEPDEDIVTAVKTMLENGIRRLPVIENEKFVGMITSSDIINAFDKGFK